MTETERMFVFTALAILIGDYLRRMFPPLPPEPRFAPFAGFRKSAET